MKTICLSAKAKDGRTLKAEFLPEIGMNLISYRLDETEVIDQSTKEMFEKKFGGLGPLIGPHFHRRPLHLIPTGLDEAKFPHIQYFKNDAKPDPFTHGIGRYVPWKVQSNGRSFKAALSGKDTWQDVPLQTLEGQNFEMHFSGELTHSGLNLELSVVSDTDSLVGIHYYYALPNGKGTVISEVQKHYLTATEKKPLPAEWTLKSSPHSLNYSLEEEADFTFFPYPNPLEGRIVLDTETHQVITRYTSLSEENSWQLWHPEGKSFACIEPISSQDPRHPNLTASALRIHLEIITK